jgi:hypothetical protein
MKKIADLFSFVVDGGDGSAHTVFFTNKEDADKALKLMEDKEIEAVSQNEGGVDTVEAYESYAEWHEATGHYYD